MEGGLELSQYKGEHTNEIEDADRPDFPYPHRFFFVTETPAPQEYFQQPPEVTVLLEYTGTKTGHHRTIPMHLRSRQKLQSCLYNFRARAGDTLYVDL